MYPTQTDREPSPARIKRRLRAPYYSSTELVATIPKPVIKDPIFSDRTYQRWGNVGPIEPASSGVMPLDWKFHKGSIGLGATVAGLVFFA